MVLSTDRIRDVCEVALVLAGVPKDHATIQVDILLEAEMRGRPSHGLRRLSRIIERIKNGVADPRTKGSLAWRGSALLDVDGGRGLGPIVACTALDALCERVGETGVAVAAIGNNNHLGMMAWYAERIAQRGYILIALSTSEALVHPWGGARALIGTNPIAIGIPASPRAFVLDMATSLVSMGQIHDYAAQNKPIPAHWALDANGRPTTDAAVAAKGAIAPFGEAKGYALGLALELLVTSLTSAALGPAVVGTLNSTAVCNKGDVFIVIDAASSSAMASSIGAYLELIRTDPPADGFDRIFIPGDRSLAIRAQRLQDGIEVAAEVWSNILKLADMQEIVF